MPEYKLPDVGEGLVEAEIVSWKVKVGDVVAINDIVVEIETAKSIVELPTPYAGAVTAILVAEGEMVAVGTPIIAIGEEAAVRRSDAGARCRPRRRWTCPTRPPPAAARASPWSAATRPTAARSAAPARCRPVRSPRTCRPRRRSSPVPSPMVEADEPPVPSTAAPAGAAPAVRVLAKPPVRKLAKDLGVDLDHLPRPGPNGTVSA